MRYAAASFLLIMLNLPLIWLTQPFYYLCALALIFASAVVLSQPLTSETITIKNESLLFLVCCLISIFLLFASRFVSDTQFMIALAGGFLVVATHQCVESYRNLILLIALSIAFYFIRDFLSIEWKSLLILGASLMAFSLATLGIMNALLIVKLPQYGGESIFPNYYYDYFYRLQAVIPATFYSSLFIYKRLRQKHAPNYHTKKIPNYIPITFGSLHILYMIGTSLTFIFFINLLTDRYINEGL